MGTVPMTPIDAKMGDNKVVNSGSSVLTAIAAPELREKTALKLRKKTARRNYERDSSARVREALRTAAKPLYAVEMGDREEEKCAKPTDAEGRFSFSTTYQYLRSHKFTQGASKPEKNSLQRLVKFFRVHNEDLYYLGGGKLNFFKVVN